MLPGGIEQSREGIAEVAGIRIEFILESVHHDFRHAVHRVQRDDGAEQLHCWTGGAIDEGAVLRHATLGRSLVPTAEDVARLLRGIEHHGVRVGGGGVLEEVGLGLVRGQWPGLEPRRTRRRQLCLKIARIGVNRGRGCRCARSEPLVGDIQEIHPLRPERRVRRELLRAAEDDGTARRGLRGWTEDGCHAVAPSGRGQLPEPEGLPKRADGKVLQLDRLVMRIGDLHREDDGRLLIVATSHVIGHELLATTGVSRRDLLLPRSRPPGRHGAVWIHQREEHFLDVRLLLVADVGTRLAPTHIFLDGVRLRRMERMIHKRPVGLHLGGISEGLDVGSPRCDHPARGEHGTAARFLDPEIGGPILIGVCHIDRRIQERSLKDPGHLVEELCAGVPHRRTVGQRPARVVDRLHGSLSKVHLSIPRQPVVPGVPVAGDVPNTGLCGRIWCYGRSRPDLCWRTATEVTPHARLKVKIATRSGPQPRRQHLVARAGKERELAAIVAQQLLCVQAAEASPLTTRAGCLPIQFVQCLQPVVAGTEEVVIGVRVGIRPGAQGVRPLHRAFKP